MYIQPGLLIAISHNKLLITIEVVKVSWQHYSLQCLKHFPSVRREDEQEINLNVVSI